MTLITVFAWIAFDVYRALTIEPSLEISEGVLTQLDPSLDETALNQLQNRIYIPEEQINNTTIVPNDSLDSDLLLFNELTPDLTLDEIEIASETGQITTQ